MQSLEILPGIHITNDRCLLMDEGPTVIMGDLHLGYESVLEDEGIYLPRINNKSIRNSLNRIISKYEPAKIVLLGDVKHDFRRGKYEGREEVRSIVNLLIEATEVIVVKGNHDNYIQNIFCDMSVPVVDYLDIGEYRLEHGHVDSGKRPVIIGHEHPSIRMSGNMGVGMKLPCFVHSKEEGVIVLPSFSPLSSGSNLTLDKSCIMAAALKSSDYRNASIYAISDVGIIQLGKLTDILSIDE